MVETPSNFGSICGEEKIFNIWFASMFDLLEEVKHYGLLAMLGPSSDFFGIF